MLDSAGLAAKDVDFLITNCGSQVWYGGPVVSSMTRNAQSAQSAFSGGAAAGAAEGVVADEAWDAFADRWWDKTCVRRVLAQLLAQRGLLTGLTSAGGGARVGAAAGSPPVKITVDTETGAHHLLLKLHSTASSVAGAAGAGAPPAAALSAADTQALISRIKRRFRSSGLRTQVTAQAEGDGSVRLHVTPLRASRALALRWLAQKHKVELTNLAVVRWVRRET
jgi:hypothetical protein